MASNLPVLNLRMNQIIKDKIAYIAKKNGRSSNKEIEQLIIQHITKYEAEHGEIILPDQEEK